MSFSWQETFFFFFALSISLEKECQKTEDVCSVVKVFFKGACQAMSLNFCFCKKSARAMEVDWQGFRVSAEGHC